MQLRSALLSGFLIFSASAQVTAASLAGNIIHAVNGLNQRASTSDDAIRNHVDSIFSSLHIRDDSAASDPINQVNMSSWNSQTSKACGSAVASLIRKANNPSGIGVCYNLPFFDNSSGIFEAELRMYNLTAPWDPWTGVTSKDISMTLSFEGANVQQAKGMPTTRKRDEDGTLLSWPFLRERSAGLDDILTRRAPGPQEIKVLMYVGQINRDRIDEALSAEQFQNILTPHISFAARSPLTNQELNTTLSNAHNTISYVSGIFSQKSTADITNGGADVDADTAISFLIPGYRLPPLDIPGLTIPFDLIFPTGLIITLIWTFLFIVAVGWGTFGRIRFRDQYRRRVQMDAAVGIRTI
ncbi:uncharacterized protein K452DRAFT_291832 [Aplosporella prunicola CBS 121167]|uniref:Uncharacterized protein n=1 Tax=Aplosporella prunicola CBS 121167 TaxID=1176127 RepID=A0A6A6AZ25_9PEZI|nr:uncharacterized protein K452DRAFT_291832 [Aplosporella prunicola CBS 121167]KAF2137169.1 hypothetical protein K452DRAFT_291832 [Aplosporella prunicola CBS 121167]